MSNITLGFAAAPFALTQTCHTLVALLSWVIVVTARFFVLPLLQHWNIWWVDSPTLLWDPALMCWLLSCFSMVTMEIFARANNCSLSSRCGCFLSWTNKRLWVAFRDDHQKGTSWPCSFVIRHGGRILQKQLLHKIFFYPVHSSGNPPIKCCRTLFCSQLPAPRKQLPEHCKDILRISWWLCHHFRISFVWECYGSSWHFWVVKA